MKVLSLFDGISCARVALERAGIPVEEYYASEVDKYAMSISQKNYPDIYQLGSVIDINGKKFGTLARGFDNIDLLIGGSPCQDLSIAKKDRKGLDGERSGLFWEYVRILKEVKPKYFILENVNSMPKEAKQIITETLGVEPIMINASLVSAQNRKRLFWTNIPNVIQPEDKGILLKDILENGDVDRLKSYAIDASYYKGANWKQYKEKGRRQLVIGTKRIGQLNTGGQGDRIYSPEGKSVGSRGYEKRICSCS
jgi:DNA-cytosine methyltransferase